jgi:hypothetical protein
LQLSMCQIKHVCFKFFCTCFVSIIHS